MLEKRLEHLTEKFGETQELLSRLFAVLATHSNPHQLRELEALWQDYLQVMRKVDQEYENA
jgi:hypothetical protein